MARSRPPHRPGPPRSPWADAADLHVHTTHSDGVCSPGEVVRAAASVGLGAVAITDHDTVSAVAVARPEAARVGVELIPGVELTAEYAGREVHILGLFIRDDDPTLVAATDALRLARRERIAAMAGRLAELGLHVDLAALRAMFPRATLGRKHLAEWLARTGQVPTARDAFVRYLGDGGPAEVSKPRLPYAEAIGLIGGSGGVAALAHPPYDLRDSDLGAMAEAGLAAIEVAGSRPQQRDRATRLGLIPVAGTDFHAPDRPGRWVGAITTPAADLAALRRCVGRGSDAAVPVYVSNISPP